MSALAWNPHDRELVSSHGFSKFDIKVWRYPTMAQIGQLTGHTQRILHMALSPDGTTVCSAAADESLRFFRCFAAPASASGKVRLLLKVGRIKIHVSCAAGQGGGGHWQHPGPVDPLRCVVCCYLCIVVGVVDAGVSVLHVGCCSHHNTGVYQHH